MQRPDAKEMARGKWLGILTALGVPAQFLRNRHGPCPICKQGKDRFRWDDKDGTGSYICGACGAGSGFDLLMKIRGWDFREAVKEVEAIVGDIAPGKVRQQRSEAALRKDRRTLWKATRRAAQGDLVDRYLRSRGIEIANYPSSLRSCERLAYGHGATATYHPAMVALVSNPDGSGSTLHRTYLAPDGTGKAAVEAPRRLMPGTVGKGAAICLGEPGKILGIAEGIETALSAAILFDVPVWAAVSSAMMQAWEPPAGVEEVVIFGDRDENYAGQKAAYTLAHRLACCGMPTTVELPDIFGDWNDELKRKRCC